jgi:hypothetical protein
MFFALICAAVLGDGEAEGDGSPTPAVVGEGDEGDGDGSGESDREGLAPRAPWSHRPSPGP